MDFKGVNKWINKNLMSNEMLIVFLMILVVIVIIDCNTKMFSKMIEGNSPVNGIATVNGTCGRDSIQPPQNPTNEAKHACKFNPADIKGSGNFNVSGYDEELLLYSSVDKPLGPTIPRTMQQDFTVLKAFGLTKLPDVINYIPGPGPQEFQKMAVEQVDSRTVDSKSKKEVHVKMYYAPWCGHSKKAKPEMDKFIDNHHNTNVNGVSVKASIVHSDHDKEEVKKQNISGFPTFKAHLYEDGNELSSYVIELPERSYNALKSALDSAVDKVQSA